LALIAIDSAAFSYQSSNLEIFNRLPVLRSTPFVFLDRELGDLRPNLSDASTFATATYLLPLRTKHLPKQRRFIGRALGASKQLAAEASNAQRQRGHASGGSPITIHDYKAKTGTRNSLAPFTISLQNP
jgi:hypothetical protein